MYNKIVGQGCGEVVQSHLVVEGAAFRKFEGEEDKNHHGKQKKAIASCHVSVCMHAARRPEP